MKRILFIFGGYSSEYGVSLQSAGAVLHALDQARYAPIMLGITKEGRWLYYTGDVGAIVGNQWQKNKTDIIPCTPIVDRGEGAILLLDGSERRVYFDAVFPVLHGKNGEDGTVQGLLSLWVCRSLAVGCLVGPFAWIRTVPIVWWQSVVFACQKVSPLESRTAWHAWRRRQRR